MLLLSIEVLLGVSSIPTKEQQGGRREEERERERERTKELLQAARFPVRPEDGHPNQV